MLTWKAHSAAVYDLAFTPDGQRLVTSGGAKIRLWEWARQKISREWPSMPNCPITVSSDGEFFGRGGDYGITVLPLAGGVAPLDVYGTTPSIAFSPSGDTFVANAVSGESLRRWSIPSGSELSGGWGERTTESYPHGPLAFSPDGELLATAFLTSFNLSRRYESVLVLWDAKRGREKCRLRPTTSVGRVTRLAFSPENKLLAGIYGSTLIVWDVTAQTELARSQPTTQHFKGLTFTPDGSRLLTASNDESIRVWVAPTWAEATGYAWKIGKLGCVAVSADGTLAAAGGSTGKVVVWDLD